MCVNGNMIFPPLNKFENIQNCFEAVLVSRMALAIFHWN